MEEYLDGSGSKLYMTCHRPLPAAQGMGIWKDWAFILYDTGVCAVFDLVTRDPRPLSVFPLGSYNNGKPSRDYLNHANSCMFAAAHWEDNPVPLLYATVGTGIGYDDAGYYYRCAVENIRQRADGSFHAETVQTICYHPEGNLPENMAQPCWGSPCFLVDNDEGCLYLFSARYRTRRGYIPEGGTQHLHNYQAAPSRSCPWRHDPAGTGRHSGPVPGGFGCGVHPGRHHS